MQKRKLRFSFDYFLIGTAGIVLCIALYFLFSDGLLTSSENYDHLTQVGHFQKSKGDVRRRTDQGITWSTIGRKDKVFEGDNVFTGENSTVQIELEGGGTLQLAPNSLVVVRTQKNELEISLKYGSLQGQIESKKKIVLLDDSGKRQQLSGENSELKISRSKRSNKTQVEVLKGQVAIEDKSGEKQVVKKNQSAEISLDKEVETVKVDRVELERVDLLQPANADQLWLKHHEPISFKWTPPKLNPEVHFEVSKDSEFKTKLISRVTSSDSSQYEFDYKNRGKIYWRIFNEDKGKKSRVTSNVHSLTIWPDEPPSLRKPLANSTIELDREDPKKRSIDFEWSDDSNSTSFALQISQDPQFKELAYSDEKIRESNFSLSRLASGKYYWRVRGQNPERKNSPWSTALMFNVQGDDRLTNAPELKNPQLAYTIEKRTLDLIPMAVQKANQKAKVEEIPNFEWTKPVGAKSYRIEVSESPQFTDPEKFSSKTEFAKLPQIRPGAIYWRVIGQNADGKDGDSSNVGLWSVAVPPPVLKEVPPVSKKYLDPDELKNDKIPIDLQWSTLGYAREYELEWALDDTFKVKKSLFSKSTQRTLPILNARTYAWRVRGLDQNRKAISAWSKPGQVSIEKILEGRKLAAIPDASPQPPAAPVEANDPGTPGLPVPKLKEPLPNTAMVAFGNTPVFLNFNWKAIPGAISYQIQISKSTDFEVTERLVDQKVKSTNYIVNSGLTTGKFYWRVRAIYSDQKSVWSNINVFNVDYR